MIIWLASYPKSGNTWVRSFLTAYYHSPEGEFNFELLNNIKQYPTSEFFDEKIDSPDKINLYWEKSQQKIILQKKIVILKTHNSLSGINSNFFTTPKTSIGSIYVVRDPRNVLTSIKNHYEFNYEETLEFMKNENKYIFDNRQKDKIDYATTHFLSSWSNHYKSWMNSNSLRRMVIKYEDLVKDPYEVFRDLIVYVNTLSRKNEKVNKSKLIRSIETTSFKNLKLKEEKGEFLENVYGESKNKITFFNLGPENYWKKNIPEKMHKKVNNTFKDDLKNLDYQE